MRASRRANATARAGAALLLVVALTTGCTAISPSTKYRIEAPVNCRTAEEDIAYLKGEKSGFGFRTLSVITGLFPRSAIVLIVRGLANSPEGAWPDKFRVGFGVYNRKIDDKIERTRSECGISTSLLWGWW